MVESQFQLSHSEFRQISDLVRRRCGIDLGEGKRDLVQARIARRLRAGGYSSVREYLDRVLADVDGEEMSGLIDVISTNLTSFFRESSHFEFLARRHLPEVMERKRRRGCVRIRGWSAGCSSGEEPYSIAMTVLETVRDSGAWDVKLLATDISRPVLETARRGVYPSERVAAIPAPLLRRYFSPVPGRSGHVSAGSELRSVIRFNYLNLIGAWPFNGPFDFIFCRNVMIYFDKPTQQTLVERFWNVLDVGGVLFTGHSESLTGIDHRFRYVQPTIYRKG